MSSRHASDGPGKTRDGERALEEDHRSYRPAAGGVDVPATARLHIHVSVFWPWNVSPNPKDWGLRVTVACKCMTAQQMIKVLVRKTKTFVRNPRRAIAGKIFERDIRQATAYLERNGVMETLVRKHEGELSAKFDDLYNLHRHVRQRRPQRILEFGLGFSSLVMAHALRENYMEHRRISPEAAESNRGTLWCVDANAVWIENTKQKIPDDLFDFIDIQHSEAEACVVNGELCHRYSELPNIVPDFLYLDGPDPRDVKGRVCGLGFGQEVGHGKGWRRAPVSADLLLLESTLRPGFFMVIDGRVNNMHFLQRHLQRRYKVKWNRLHDYSTFELLY